MELNVNMNVSNQKVRARVIKYMSTLSAYPTVDNEQPMRVYIRAEDNELIAFQSMIYNITWFNNSLKFDELAKAIDQYNVMTFSDLRNALYSLA